MSYPSDLLFDLETLLNEAQPNSILLLGDAALSVVENYQTQRKLIQQPCTLKQLQSLPNLDMVNTRYDMAIVAGFTEQLSKQETRIIIARLRDVLVNQFCLAVTSIKDVNNDNEIKNQINNEVNDAPTAKHWPIHELLALGLNRVAEYQDSVQRNQSYALYKYSLKQYKRTPGWLNSDNWANPEIWNKYRW